MWLIAFILLLWIASSYLLSRMPIRSAAIDKILMALLSISWIGLTLILGYEAAGFLASLLV